MKLLTAAILLALFLASLQISYHLGERAGVRQGHREFQQLIDAAHQGEPVKILGMRCVYVDELPPGRTHF